MAFNPSMLVQNPNPAKSNSIKIGTLILYASDSSYRFQPQAIEILNGLRKQGVISDTEIERVKKTKKESPRDKINSETGVPKQDDTIITLKDGTALTKEMINTPDKIDIIKANKNNLNFAFLIPYLNDEYLDEFITSDSPQIRKMVAENIDINKLGEFSNEIDKDVLDMVIDRITVFDGRKLLRTNPNLNAEQTQKLTSKIENFDMFINDLKNLKEVSNLTDSDNDKEVSDNNFTIKSIKEEFDYINTLEGQDFLDVMNIIKEKVNRSLEEDKLDIIDYLEPEKLSDYFIFEMEHDPQFYKKKTDIEKENDTNKIIVYRGGKFKDNRGYVTTDKEYAKEFGKIEKLLIDKNDILDLTNPEHRELISTKFGADMLRVLSPNADKLPNVSDRITLDKLEDIAKKLGFKATAQSEGKGLENSFDVYDGNILEEYKQDKVEDSYFKNKDNYSDAIEKMAKDNYDALLSLAEKFSKESFNKIINIKKEIINNLEPDDLMLFAEDKNEEIREILSYKVPKQEISGLLEKYTTDKKLENIKSIINLIDRDTKEEDFHKLIYYDNANVRKAISSKIKDPQILEKFLNSELNRNKKSKTTITNILSNISENQIKNIEKYNPKIWNNIKDFIKDKYNINLNDSSEFQSVLNEIEHNKKEELKQQELLKQEEKKSEEITKTAKENKDFDAKIEDNNTINGYKGIKDIPLNDINIEKGKNIIKYKLNIPLDNSVKDVFKELNENGNRALIVGGSVRDALLGKSPKDIDIEVYNINYRDLNEILSKFGKTDTVGKAFGIIKFTDKNGNSYDFSLPRKESKTGVGHKGFDVEFDEDMTPKEAASRRDFTWNALAYDPLTNEIHDYYNGISDLKNNILKHTSEKFNEDPLRILRAMQFQGRYGFDIDKDTLNLMKKMVKDGELDSLALERITEEWSKWASKGKHPSKLFDFLRDTGLIEKLPYLSKLKETEQDPEWHPEGNVEEHTKHVMDAAAKIADRDNLNADDRTVLLFAALLHDIAKPQTTTKEIKNGKERITSKGHEQAGGKLANEFLKSIGVKQSIIDKIIPLIENHLSHVNIASIKNEKGQLSAIRKLAVKLGDATITDLLRLIEADHSGRPPLETGLPESGKLLQNLAKKLKVTEKPEPALITGKDLIKLGFSQGKELGDMLKKVKEAQYDGEFDSKEKGIEWVKNYMEKELNIIPPTWENKGYSNYTASQRINLNKLPYYNEANKDFRKYINTYELPDNKILQVAKNAYGLMLNYNSEPDYMVSDFVAKVYEVGKDYVVFEKLNDDRDKVLQFLKPFMKFTQYKFNAHDKDLMELLNDVGMGVLESYDIDYNQFITPSNWGTDKEGNIKLKSAIPLTKNEDNIDKISDNYYDEWDNIKSQRNITNSDMRDTTINEFFAHNPSYNKGENIENVEMESNDYINKVSEDGEVIKYAPLTKNKEKEFLDYYKNNKNYFTEEEKKLIDFKIKNINPINEASNKTFITYDDKNDKIGIYKNRTGEVFIRDNIPVGTYYKREVAAYIVDKIFNFNIVPPTIITTTEKGGIGSFQKFIKDKNTYYKSPKLITNKNKLLLAFFDFIIGNDDRHDENFMVNNEGTEINAIDNALSFPIKNTNEFKFTDDLYKIKNIEESKLKDIWKSLKNYDNILKLKKEIYDSGFINRTEFKRVLSRINALLENNGDFSKFAKYNIDSYNNISNKFEDLSINNIMKKIKNLLNNSYKSSNVNAPFELTDKDYTEINSDKYYSNFDDIYEEIKPIINKIGSNVNEIDLTKDKESYNKFVFHSIINGNNTYKKILFNELEDPDKYFDIMNKISNKNFDIKKNELKEYKIKLNSFIKDMENILPKDKILSYLDDENLYDINTKIIDYYKNNIDKYKVNLSDEKKKEIQDKIKNIDEKINKINNEWKNISVNNMGSDEYIKYKDEISSKMENLFDEKLKLKVKLDETSKAKELSSSLINKATELAEKYSAMKEIDSISPINNKYKIKDIFKKFSDKKYSDVLYNYKQLFHEFNQTEKEINYLKLSSNEYLNSDEGKRKLKEAQNKKTEILKKQNELKFSLIKKIFVENQSELSYKIKLFDDTENSSYLEKGKKLLDNTIPLFNKIISKEVTKDIKTMPNIIMHSNDVREFYNHEETGIHIDLTTNPITVIHELGHYLEDNNLNIKKLCNDFFNKRTAGDPVEKLKDITNKDYLENEVAKKDNFFMAYCGKIYNPDNNSNLIGTEILSMGLEMMVSNPLEFAIKDPDYFEFVYNVMNNGNIYE